MFVPSPYYFRQTGGIGFDRTVNSPFYCCPKQQQQCIEDIINIPKSEKSYHSYNPNIPFSVDAEDEMYWLQYSDFYEWPHIQYFDNAMDLEHKVGSTDLMKVHNMMKKENFIRQNLILSQWKSIIDSIPENRS